MTHPRRNIKPVVHVDIDLPATHSAAAFRYHVIEVPNGATDMMDALGYAIAAREHMECNTIDIPHEEVTPKQLPPVS